MATAKVGTATPVVPHFNRSEPGSVNLALATFPKATKEKPEDVDNIAQTLIDKFNAALSSQDTQAILDLFLEDCYWRDHLGLSWNFHTLKGKEKMSDFLGAETKGLKKLTINRSTAFRAPHYGALDGAGNINGVEFFVDFEAEKGIGNGLCRILEETAGMWKIFSLFTTLKELKDIKETTYHNRPEGVAHGENKNRENWLDRRNKDLNYENGKEPAVLIVGAGQGGMTAAARLKVLGVDTLIIDKLPRVGDNWRNRYKSLVLHDPVKFDNMPLIEFPPFWPTFTPKDKLAGWFELYAQALELNIWNSSKIKSSSWDKEKKQWTVVIDRTKPDGSKEERTFHPRHVIQATGHSGKMNFPDIKGMDTFKGRRLCHSSEFPGVDQNAKSKKAIVVGSCNSGHDLCQTFYENGYDITMVQRTSTCVVSSKAITNIALKGLYDDDGPPTEDADVWLFGTPSAVLKAIQVGVTELQGEHDKEVLSGLEKAGFKLDKGPDAAGLFLKYFQRGGGYYIDVGASQLIIDGKIKIKQGVEIEEVTEKGLKFADGSELEADEIIFATGYQNMRSEARTIFGDELADQVGDIWGFDDEGEMRTIWRPSGHPGFWFMGGNFALCRYYSRLLALQIKAMEEGLVQ
ncbi:hypothetical protein LTR64_004804 [Lithohypha guttulata]|uniref:uncharacterized protein n=1 Tax=Lithohypha guttulata TaxID=1690604 RepID=UPI002DE0FDE5|nr:hypothetical protein LTR51_005362 [Lithohypha guttulata]